MATVHGLVAKSTTSRLLRPIAHFHRTLTKSAGPPKAVEESPVKFTSSKAASWTARGSRGDIVDDSPWFQPYVVLSSIAVFMIYFCVLREENDIDIELSKTLYDRIPGLEKKQLELSLTYNESKGLDTTDIKNRLDEIEREESG